MIRKLTFILIFGLLVGAPSAHAVAVNLISVVFQATPLFSGSNLVPGAEVTRYVRVTNTTNVPTPITFDATNETDTGLGQYIHLSVRQDGAVLYNDTLANLFANGAAPLSDVRVGQTVQYDFTATFDTDAGNEVQGQTVTFDLVIAAQGAEGETLASDNPGGTVTGGGTYYNTPTPTPTPTLTPTPTQTPTPTGIGATPTPTPSGQSGSNTQGQSEIGNNTFSGSEGTSEGGQSPSPSSLVENGSSSPNNLLATIGSFFGDVPSWIWWLTLSIFGLSFAFWLIRRQRRKHQPRV